MTPPIIQNPQQNFSGDSQDSSSKLFLPFEPNFCNLLNSFTEGYTSISVREPLANIIAQTKQQNADAKARRRDLTDSHYATVSDDSGNIKFQYIFSSFILIKFLHFIQMKCMRL